MNTIGARWYTSRLHAAETVRMPNSAKNHHFMVLYTAKHSESGSGRTDTATQAGQTNEKSRHPRAATLLDEFSGESEDDLDDILRELIGQDLQLLTLR